MKNNVIDNFVDKASKVNITSVFWKHRIRVNREITIPHCLEMCEDTGRIENFRVAANAIHASYSGSHYNDSDVFKLIESMSHRLSNDYDAATDSAIDGLVNLIAMAQEKDGYLYTARTAGQNISKMGHKRWSHLKTSHELYNVGHLYEAAVVHYTATGKTSLLDIALKNAELICNVFGPDGINDVPGHQGIEIGLIKLYELTGDEKYLKQAKLFIDRRGRHDGQLYGEYAQDHLPVTKQYEAVGHAVRAVYMYTAMARITRITGTDEYLFALEKLWDNIVSKKLYLTGGIGSRHEGESFGDNYELPNKTAYCETCASIGMMFWNYTMFQIKKESKYFDIFEHILYNSFLSGTSIEGDSFFYVNPLESDGQFKFNLNSIYRKEWFDTACCPENITRFIEQLHKYIYFVDGDDVYINLYIASQLEFNGSMKINMVTGYPANGKIKINVVTSSELPKTLFLRVPSWLGKSPFHGNLYSYEPLQAYNINVRLNSHQESFEVVNGYLKITRVWNNDEIELDVPMPIRKVTCDPRVTGNRGRYAIEKGPIVYCLESNQVNEISDKKEHSILDLQKITGALDELKKIIDLSSKSKEPAMIPYFLWANATLKTMKVWLP